MPSSSISWRNLLLLISFCINRDHTRLLDQYIDSKGLQIPKDSNDNYYRILAIGTVLLLQAEKTSAIISNVGKSMFTKKISSGLKHGFFTLSQLRSEFCFEDLIDAQIGIGEEITVDCNNCDF